MVEGKAVRVNPVEEVVAEMRQLYDRGVRGFWFTDAQFIPARRYIEDAKQLLRAILAAGMDDIRWAAYIRADNIDAELAELMVATGMDYFEIGITSGSQELVRKMRMGYNLRTVLENCRLLARAGFREHVSVNYSFNVIDERPETIRQTVAYHRELECIFGADKVEPSIFFIGLQPHTHLEQYGFEQGLIEPGYNPMSMMPWTARKLLWNPEPMGSVFGRICLEAFETNPGDFGRTVMALLERTYGLAPWRTHCMRRWRVARRWPRRCADPGSPEAPPHPEQSGQSCPAEQSTDRVGISPTGAGQPERHCGADLQRPSQQGKPSAHQATVQAHGTPEGAAVGSPLQPQRQSEQQQTHQQPGHRREAEIEAGVGEAEDCRLADQGPLIGLCSSAKPLSQLTPEPAAEHQFFGEADPQDQQHGIDDLGPRQSAIPAGLPADQQQTRHKDQQEQGFEQTAQQGAQTHAPTHGNPERPPRPPFTPGPVQAQGQGQQQQQEGEPRAQQGNLISPPTAQKTCRRHRLHRQPAEAIEQRQVEQRADPAQPGAPRHSALRLDRAGQAFGLEGLAVELSGLQIADDHQADAGVVRFQHHGDGVLFTQGGHHLAQGAHHVLHRVDGVVVQQHLVARRGLAHPLLLLLDHRGTAGRAAGGFHGEGEPSAKGRRSSGRNSWGYRWRQDLGPRSRVPN